MTVDPGLYRSDDQYRRGFLAGDLERQALAQANDQLKFDLKKANQRLEAARATIDKLIAEQRTESRNRRADNRGPL